jgi:hypothetical protein
VHGETILVRSLELTFDVLESRYGPSRGLNIWRFPRCVTTSSQMIPRLDARLAGDSTLVDPPGYHSNHSKQSNHCNQGSLKIPRPVTREKTHVGFNVMYLLLLSNFNQNWNVLTNFNKNIQYQN